MSSTTTGERGAPENTEFAAERAMLGSRDREQLHEIASAMGVRGATRLRKADLVEAILAAATSGNGIPEPSGEKPKKRATRKKDAGNGDGDAGDGASTRSGAAEAPAAEVPAAAPAPEAQAPAAPPRFSFGPEDRSKAEAVAEVAAPDAPPGRAPSPRGPDGSTPPAAEAPAAPSAGAGAPSQFREREQH
ncbi:MAG: Rho termination factor N-terminal domain-containing protein, partial [Acidimicrobiia bacterium]